MGELELQLYLRREYPEGYARCEWKEFKNLKNWSIRQSLRFNLYFCHFYRWIFFFCFCNTKISEFFDMTNSEQLFVS